MFIQIRDINTGKIVSRRGGMIAERQTISGLDYNGCLDRARSLFNTIPDNKAFVYWVAVRNGVAIHKGQF